MVGTWKITHFLEIGEDGTSRWDTVEEYLETHKEEHDAENFANMKLVFLEDGTVLHAFPLPEDFPPEELKELLDSGEAELYKDRYLVLEKKRWKEENGDFWYDTGMTGTVGEAPADPWIRIRPADPGVEILTMRLVREA